MPNENNFSAPLLPCPFCGASAAVQNESTADNSGGYFVECKSCGASTNLRYACGDDPVPLLVAQWNARAPQTVEAQAAPAAVAAPLIARSLAEWHEDDGAVAWWAWCGHSWAGEAPFIGMPCDSDWPGYHTHWTPAPSQPAGLNATPKPPATEDSSAGDPAEVLAEPVMIYHGRCTIDCGEHGHHDVEMLKMIPAGAKLYTAPQAQPADALDAARLDFLETQKRREARDGGYSAFYTLHLPAMAAGPWQATHGGEYDHKTLRESIDAAMAAAQEGGNASAGKDGAA